MLEQTLAASQPLGEVRAIAYALRMCFERESVGSVGRAGAFNADNINAWRDGAGGKIALGRADRVEIRAVVILSNRRVRSEEGQRCRHRCGGFHLGNEISESTMRESVEGSSKYRYVLMTMMASEFRARVEVELLHELPSIYASR